VHTKKSPSKSLSETVSDELFLGYAYILGLGCEVEKMGRIQMKEKITKCWYLLKLEGDGYLYLNINLFTFANI
jgi:hypothetical protein